MTSSSGTLLDHEKMLPSDKGSNAGARASCNDTKSIGDSNANRNDITPKTDNVFGGSRVSAEIDDRFSKDDNWSTGDKRGSTCESTTLVQVVLKTDLDSVIEELSGDQELGTTGRTPLLDRAVEEFPNQRLSPNRKVPSLHSITSDSVGKFCVHALLEY